MRYWLRTARFRRRTIPMNGDRSKSMDMSMRLLSLQPEWCNSILLTGLQFWSPSSLLGFLEQRCQGRLWPLPRQLPKSARRPSSSTAGAFGEVPAPRASRRNILRGLLLARPVRRRSILKEAKGRLALASLTPAS